MSVAALKMSLPLARQAAGKVWRQGGPPHATLIQAYSLGYRSAPFVVATLACLGAILTFQAGLQADRVIGDNALTGATTLPLLLRQLGPTLCGLMLATRVGTAVAAELGNMTVTEQVDALRMCGADPVAHLVVPRLRGCVIMALPVSLLGVAAAIGAGAVMAKVGFLVPWSTYFNFSFVHGLDPVEGAAKVLAYGITTPLIASACGLAAPTSGPGGGSEGVGQATTYAVVYCSMAVIALDFVLGGLFFLLRGVVG